VRLAEALLNASDDAIARALEDEPAGVVDMVRSLLSHDQRDDDLDADRFLEQMVHMAEPASTTREAPPGLVLHECIGSGAMGEVYRATQEAPQREVAVKFVWGDGLAEAQALADAHHPLIPSVFQVGHTAKQPHVVMELVRGEGLLDWAATASLAQKLALLESLCRGVHEIHDRGVLHRDLKPANVLVDASGPRLVDFGVAVRSTRAGDRLAGTLPYLADEVLSGAPASTQSDVFSLACILVEVLSGEAAMPRIAGVSGQIEARLAHELPPLPRRAVGIARRGLAPTARRYASAAELADDLSSWRRSIAAAPRWRAAGLAGLALLGIAAWWGTVPPESPASPAAAAADRAWLKLQEAHPEASADAVEAFEGFAGLSSVRGSRAADAAILAAAHFRGALALPDTVDAVARIWASTEDAQHRVDAALMLAETFEREGRWAALGAIVDSLGPGPARDTWSTKSAIGLRNWTRADVAADPLFRELSRATRTETDGHVIYFSQDAFVAIREGELLTGPLTPRLTPAATAAPAGLGEPGRRHIVELGGWLAMAATEDGTHVSLVRQTPSGWATLAEPEVGGLLWSAAAGDPDGDGAPSLFVGMAGSQRGLRVLEGPEWRSRVVDEGLDRANSDILQLMVEDLDQDGRQELIVLVGPWRAYDLRVYSARSDGTFALQARTQLGGASRMTLVDFPDGARRLAVMKEDRYPNATLFGEASPFGVESGLYLWSYADERLIETDFIPLRSPKHNYTGFSSGDLDGDGWPEVVSEDDDNNGIIVSFSADGSTVHRVAGLYPRGIADLDGDGDDELLARVGDERILWAFGHGEDPIPTVESASVQDPLMRLGLHRAAAELAEERARLAVDDASAAASYALAAEAYDALGDAVTSHAMYDAALERGAGRGEPDVSEARAALIERALLPRPRRTSPGEDAPFVLDFRGAPPSVFWQRPAAMRASAEGLRVRATSGDGVLWSVPLRRTSEYLSLQVDLDVLHAEAGVHLTLALRDADGAALLSVTLEPWGGAGQVDRKWYCALGDQPQTLALFSAPRTAPAWTSTHRARLAAHGGRAVCDLKLDDTLLDRAREVQLSPSEALVLELRAHGSVPGAKVDATLSTVTLHGMVPTPRPSTGWRERIVSGDVRAAVDEAEGVEKLEALADLGRQADAQEAWLTSDTDRSSELAMFRRNPILWLDVLRTAAPETAPERIAEGWHGTYESGSTELIAYPWVDALPVTSASVAALLTAHAHALLAEGHLDRALRLFERLAEEALPAATGFEVALGLAEARGRAQLETAPAACESAAALEPHPFALRDRVASNPALQQACVALHPPR